MEVEFRGDTAFVQLLTAMGTKAPQAMVKCVRGFCEDVLTDSKENYVPVVTGALRKSGMVRVVPMATFYVGIVGFGGDAAPYAHAVHENPNAGAAGAAGAYGPSGRSSAVRVRSGRGSSATGHSKVGQWKYLSTPFEIAKNDLPARMTALLQEIVQG